MSRPEAICEDAAVVVDPIELDRADFERADVDLGEIMAVLAHDFRNPLASLQGCAQTLLDRGSELDPDLRHRLTEVVVRHAQRLDWLVRASAEFGGASQRGDIDRVDVHDVVVAAASTAGVPVDVRAVFSMVGNERRLQLAFEAVLIVLGERASVVVDGASVEITGSQTDLERGGNLWKMHLASRVFREEGAEMRALVSSHGAAVTIRFANHIGGWDE